MRESLNVRRRGLGGVKRVWEGPNFGQRGPGVFGLPFKNRFRLGLEGSKGFGLGISYGTWPKEQSTSLTLN